MNIKPWISIDSSSVSRIRVIGNDLDIEFRTTGAIYRWVDAASEFDELLDMNSKGKSVGTYVNVVMKNKYEKPILLNNDKD